VYTSDTKAFFIAVQHSTNSFSIAVQQNLVQQFTVLVALGLEEEQTVQEPVKLSNGGRFNFVNSNKKLNK